VGCTDLFQKKGQRTDVFVRFSTVAGGVGSIDTSLDVRGFAVKFYTRQGTGDLVGNNAPSYSSRTRSRFPT
jgi:catalase